MARRPGPRPASALGRPVPAPRAGWCDCTTYAPFRSIPHAPTVSPACCSAGRPSGSSRPPPPRPDIDSGLVSNAKGARLTSPSRPWSRPFGASLRRSMPPARGRPARRSRSGRALRQPRAEPAPNARRQRSGRWYHRHPARTSAAGPRNQTGITRTRPPCSGRSKRRAPIGHPRYGGRPHPPSRGRALTGPSRPRSVAVLHRPQAPPSTAAPCATRYAQALAKTRRTGSRGARRRPR